MRKKAGQKRGSVAREHELLAEILSDPERDRAPLANPVVSVHEQDEPAYLASVEACALAAAGLERRGAWHGEWAELDPERLTKRLRQPIPAEDEFLAAIGLRWHAARPVLLPGIASELLPAFADEIAARAELHRALADTGGLRRFLAENAPDIEPEFHALTRACTLADAERDVERVRVEALAPGGTGKRAQDLWIKSSWLSTHADDESLRLRFSFGREQEDDASRDLRRQRLVAELATRLLPESAAVSANPELVTIVEHLCAEAALFTQHIAYWNSPSGGALFHHDAFAEDALDEGAFRQFGVCYTQLSGATAWLALSLEDLATRVSEFAELLADGEMPWVLAQLYDGPKAPFPGGWRRFQELVRERAWIQAELALPGCGELAPLVNRGPEFTSFLADLGHAYFVRAGDTILLPNEGLEKTCMHSVFCAGDETAYSLSMAIRPDREPPLPTEGAPSRRRIGAVREKRRDRR